MMKKLTSAITILIACIAGAGSSAAATRSTVGARLGQLVDNIKLSAQAVEVSDALGTAAVLEGLPCTKTYTNGRTIRTSSCGGEFESQVCCSFDDYIADIGGCVAHCECSYEEERVRTRVTDEIHHPTLLRGVPIFLQYDAKDRSGNQPVGCGGVAVSMLASWFSARGYTKLTKAYKSDGEVNWKALTTELAEDYLDTWIRNNASPTYIRKIQSGIEKYWEDKGYDVHVNKYKTKDGEEAEEFKRIKASINAGRPVIIGFDVDLNKGGGIGGGGDDFGWIDHYGLIVGYDDTGARNKVYINMGWGDVNGSLCSSDGTDCHGIENGVVKVKFKVGKGKVHTWHVSMNGEQKTKKDGVVVTSCPIPDPDDSFKPNKIDGTAIGATFEDESSLPVKNVLIAGTDCAVVGGTETLTETYGYTARWTETISCNSRYDLFDDVLDGEWDPETPDLDLGPLDELKPVP